MKRILFCIESLFLLLFFNCDFFLNPFLGTNVDRNGPQITLTEPTPTINNGLVRYYPFNGNANDETGNGYNGTVTGATLTTDRFGNPDSCYNFDGNDRIEANATNLPTAERTVAFWFYVTSIGRPGLLGYGGNGCGTTWFMGLNIGGSGSFHMSCHCNVNAINYSYGGSAPSNAWYHFVITTSSSGTRLYVNGDLKTSNGTYVTGTYVNGRELGIGVITNTAGTAPYTDANVTYTTGKIDDVRFYDTALSDCEVKKLYNYNGVNDLIFTAAETIYLSCTVNDTEDGKITGASLVWTSNIDGVIGQGESISTALSAGEHIITLTASDKRGNKTTKSTDTITIISCP